MGVTVGAELYVAGVVIVPVGPGADDKPSAGTPNHLFTHAIGNSEQRRSGPYANTRKTTPDLLVPLSQH